MQKFVTLLSVLIITAFVAGCGGNSPTTAATITYTPLPSSLAPTNSHMGGAVQGTALALSKIVSTFAGSVGTAGLLDTDTVTGTTAKFNHPTGITTDGTNFYVTDYLNNAIRKIDTNGVVTTLQCTDLDTGVAIFFNRPTDITTDGTNLYVVDSGSNTIRFIDLASNKVTTIGSSTGVAGAVDSTVKTDVRFSQPTGITTDRLNLYVTDSGNNTIRRIDIATKAVTTLAGTPGTAGSADGIQGAARFNLPGRITTDGSSLYVTEFNNRTVRKIDIATAGVTTIAGNANVPRDTTDADATGTAALFNQPNGITTDGTNLYVTDSYNNTIRRIVIATGAVTKIAGITYGQAGSPGHVDSADGTPSFDTPIGITTDGTSLYVADSQNNTIRKIE